VNPLGWATAAAVAVLGALQMAAVVLLLALVARPPGPIVLTAPAVAPSAPAPTGAVTPEPATWTPPAGAPKAKGPDPEALRNLAADLRGGVLTPAAAAAKLEAMAGR
jgi:hypothetical protein